MMELKPNKMLNGISYRYGDLYDSWNQVQKDHYDGKIDVYSPRINAPSIADAWKEDARRRFGKRNK